MGNIEWTLVESSNVAAIGYDEEAKELHVQFSYGAVYAYYNVPTDVHKAFLDADSKGKYLNEHIKGVYEFKKL